MPKAKACKVPLHYKYERNDFLQCTCTAGNCPNYNAKLCNRVGGKTISPNFNYFKNIKSLRKLLHKDINVSAKKGK